MEATSADIHSEDRGLSLFFAILIAHRAEQLSWLAALWTPAPSDHMHSICCARESCRFPKARPALGACPAGQSPPGDASLCPIEESRIATHSRARLALEELSQSSWPIGRSNCRVWLLFGLHAPKAAWFPAPARPDRQPRGRPLARAAAGLLTPAQFFATFLAQER